MKVRILIPNDDGYDFKDSVPFNIPVIPPFGTRLNLSKETLIAMEDIVYNSDNIYSFNKFLYGHGTSEAELTKMSNEEIKENIAYPYLSCSFIERKMRICFDDYDAVVDIHYKEKDETFYLTLGCAYTQLNLHAIED
jgi:hypothetical protein